MFCAIFECVYWLRAATLSITAHQSVLGLFDEEGLAVLAQLHVQTHRLAINLDVHLRDKTMRLTLNAPIRMNETSFFMF